MARNRDDQRETQARHSLSLTAPAGRDRSRPELHERQRGSRPPAGYNLR